MAALLCRTTDSISASPPLGKIKTNTLLSPYSHIFVQRDSMGKNNSKSPFAIALQIVRKQLGLTQKQAAIRTSVSASSFAKFESGERPPTMAIVYNIVHGLALSKEEAENLISLRKAEIQAKLLGSSTRETLKEANGE